jgi:hypothetical protein
MMKSLPSLAMSFTLVAGLAAAAGAQTVPVPAQQTTTQQTTTTPDGQTTTTVTKTYVDSKCGTWNGDTWVATPGACDATVVSAYKHERVAGTITSVSGHLVTIQQADKQLVINDTPALNNQLTGKVAVGRQVVAHGYWDHGNFYATLLTTSDAAAHGM